MASADRSHELYTQYLIMGPMTTIAVAARVVARVRSNASFGLDDLFALLALVLYWAHVGLSLWGIISGGSGRDINSLSLPEILVDLKVLYVGMMTTVATITSAKLSVLFLYYRIFRVNPKFKIAWIVLLVLTVSWFLTTFLLAVFRCNPVEAAWNPLIPHPQCLNVRLGFLVTETINCVTDFAIVCLPGTMIRSLQLPMKLKAGLCFVFMLGGLVCVTSIIRIAYSYKSDPSGDALINAGVWVNLQLSTAILCACLPTYRSILPGSASVQKTLRQWQSLVFRKTRASTPSSSNDLTEVNSENDSVSERKSSDNKYSFSGDNSTEHVVFTHIKPGRRPVRPPPPNAINVETHVSSHRARISVGLESKGLVNYF